MSDAPKHTPGPWRWVQHANHVFSIVDSNNEIVGCDIYAITEPNRSLIAAAPEMLEALKALRSQCWGGCSCTDPSDEENAAWDLAFAAIAKAETRQL